MKEKILIVDDNKGICDLLANCLQEFPTITACDGEEGLQKFKEEKVCLVISDYQMPKLDGLGLLEAIKKIRADVPVIMMTGYGTEELVIAALNNGLVAYFQKPDQLEKLCSKATELYQARIKEWEEEEALKAEFFNDSAEATKELEYKVLNVATNAENLQDIKRGLHTLKGTASFFKAFEQIEELCHAAEDMIKKNTADGAALTEEAVDALLNVLDLIDQLLIGLKQQDDFRLDLAAILTRLAGITPSAEQKAGTDNKNITNLKLDVEAKSKGIFVANEKLDVMMELAGELIILGNNVMGISIKNLSEQQLKELFHQLDSISTEMQRTIMDIRKVPLADVFRPYHRVVRNMAQALQKEIALKVNIANIFVDKDVSMILSEALVHIIRNSVDHGIELPAERQNKPTTATIEISARQTESSTVVLISDDGMGIDTDAVKQKALEKKLVTSAELERMSDEEINNLIFLPGFSTSKQVSKISGRGEGMDIVRNAINKLNGRLAVRSTRHAGSVFSIDIPYLESINICSALLVNVSSMIFAIPITEIDNVISVKSSEIHRLSDDKNFIVYNKENLLIMKLSELIKLGYTKREWKNGDELTVVVLMAKGRKMALIVDSTDEQMQIVVKALDGFLHGVIGFKGTTILKNSMPAFVLDGEQLINMGMQTQELQIAS